MSLKKRANSRKKRDYDSEEDLDEREDLDESEESYRKNRRKSSKNRPRDDDEDDYRDNRNRSSKRRRNEDNSDDERSNRSGGFGDSNRFGRSTRNLSKSKTGFNKTRNKAEKTDLLLIEKMKSDAQP